MMTTEAQILVVEDERIVAENIRNNLNKLGYGVPAVVASGEEAVQLAGEMRPDLVLMDINLAGEVDGVEAAEQIRARFDIPVIYLTGYTDEVTVERARVSVPLGYLVKPVGATDLRGAIEVALYRHEMDRKLKESEENFRALANSANDGIVIVTSDGLLVYANEQAADMTGYRVDELLEMRMKDVAHPDELRKWETRFQQRLAGQAPPNQYETAVIRKAGGVVPVEVTAARTVWRGQPAGVIVVRDITERKRREEQLVQAQKMETIGRLAGGIAHEFNNTLTSITGYARFVEEALPSGSAVRGDIEQVLKGAERLAGLTRRLLAFSRRQMIRPRPLDLTDLVLDMGETLRVLIGENVELVLPLAPDPGLVKADRGQIEQVLLNLVMNARDAMPDGGRLTIEMANVTLDEHDLQAHPDMVAGEYVMLAVSDTGVGMTEEVKSHLFEPFFTTKEFGQSAGLGLAAAYGIIKQHGGDMWVYSEQGKGARFELYLPQVEKPAAVEVERDTTARLPGGSETVLVVEDEPIVQDVMRRMLDTLGYTVLQATRGDEALRLAEERAGEIHLLLTDVVMPGMNGKVLADRMSDMYPHLQVLYISSYGEHTLARYGVPGEGKTLLSKPFTFRELAHKVREVLD